MKTARYISLLVVLALVAIFVGTRAEQWRYGTFDSAKWSRLSSEGKHKYRYFMARDLISSAQLIGKTSTEVRSLLGNPDKDTAGLYLLYNLGPNRGSPFKVDDDWLEIQFDDAGYVVNAKIRPD